MTSDLRSLLAAIVADPDDDTARLAYADCLDEHGNSARAEFIRLQVEAERLHPHSNSRARLDERAQVLFAEHWREWWGEVCEAVGLPADVLNAYRAAEDAALTVPRPPDVRAESKPDYRVTFRRGFPEAVAVPALASGPEPCAAYLARWSAASPLAELLVAGRAGEQRQPWPEGEHLRTVRRLTLRRHTFDDLQAARDSPHLGALERLSVYPSWATSRPPGAADVLAFDFAGAHAARLRHFAAPVRPNQFIDLLSRAEPFAALESLDLWLRPRQWHENDLRPLLSDFVDSPHLERVRRLTFQVHDNVEDLAPLLRSPAWNRLSYLEIDFGQMGNDYGIFRRGDELVGLEEIRLTGVRLTADAVRDLAKSPLVKRVKHFTLSGECPSGRLLPLVDAVDPERIETFALGIPHFPERAANALRAKFGDKLRLLPA